MALIGIGPQDLNVWSYTSQDSATNLNRSWQRGQELFRRIAIRIECIVAPIEIELIAAFSVVADCVL